MGIVKDALDNYSSYLPYFDYKNKSLKLKKPKSLHIENVGSSSNHMFLQLFFSLAIHAVAFESKSPFIAPFIVIDQPSRPYFCTDNKDKRTLKSSDESKIKQAFKLLDYFVTSIVETKGNFQMIVFEHIPSSYINDLGKIHIVEEFSDGNALITAELMSASSE